MSVVHEKRDIRPRFHPRTEGIQDIRDPAHIRDGAEVVGAGDIDCEGEPAPCSHLLQGRTHLFRSRMTGTDRIQIRVLRVDPFHVAVQHGAGVQKGFVDISRRQDNGSACCRSLFSSAEQGQIEHGADLMLPEKVLEHREEILGQLKQYYSYVALDLEAR